MKGYVKKEDAQTIVNLANPNEMIPINTFFAASLGQVTKEDVSWAHSVLNGQYVTKSSK